MITRSTSHILKYQTSSKNNLLEKMFDDYENDLKCYIELILKGVLPLKINLSTPLLPVISIESSAWRQVIYKTASEIIRSQAQKANDKRYKKYKKLYARCARDGRRTAFLGKRYSELNLKAIFKTKYFSIPALKNFSLMLDQRLVNIRSTSGAFDEFIQISSPVKDSSKKNRALMIRLPIKHYKHSLKYRNDSGWTRKKSIQFKRINGKYYANLIYERPEAPRKNNSSTIAFDQGYKKLLSDSNGLHYGAEMFGLYEKISRKKQGSKAFKRLLITRNEMINRTINEINFDDVSHIIIENLKNVKHKSKIFHTVMNKIQRWSYPKTVLKLERFCEENGVLLTKINPAYTSQTCSNCGVVDAKSRQGELFDCQHCGMKMDADSNAAMNILRIGSCGTYDSVEDTTSSA